MKVYTVSSVKPMKDDIAALITGKARRPSTQTRTRLAHMIRCGDEVCSHHDQERKGIVSGVYKQSMKVAWKNRLPTTVTLKQIDSAEGVRFRHDIAFFMEEHRTLMLATRRSQYRSWKIPKKSGGFRQIDSPNEELSAALYELKRIIESYGPLYHTGAFAYMKGREPLQAIRYHRNSNWFLKLDLHDFFGSTTTEVLERFLPGIRPFCFLEEYQIASIADMCQLNGKLPQGTCISPLITNIIMIPFDFEITRAMKKRGIRYTRYADDLLFSSEKWFPKEAVLEEVISIMAHLGYPYTINDDKTRFGSINGRNFNLGLMLNGTHKITTGWERKKHLKSEIHNFFRDEKTNTPEANKAAAYHILGIIGYMTHIEPEYTSMFIKYLGKTYQKDVLGYLKQIVAS